MTYKTWRSMIIIHILGYLTALWWLSQSWQLSNLLENPLMRTISLLLWLVVLAGFGAAAIRVLTRQVWPRLPAVAIAIVSLDILED